MRIVIFYVIDEPPNTRKPKRVIGNGCLSRAASNFALYAKVLLIAVSIIKKKNNVMGLL